MVDSYILLQVDGDTSTNDTVIALASGMSGLSHISSLESYEAIQLQACLDAVMQGLAKSIAWDEEGATCLIEVCYFTLAIILPQSFSWLEVFD
ncbi:unnamed protein product [Lathyrus sativus]|nr:unnamed protein product [Lathyrus sativus]